jgi:hypothetical protein
MPKRVPVSGILPRAFSRAGTSREQKTKTKTKKKKKVNEGTEAIARQLPLFIRGIIYRTLNRGRCRATLGIACAPRPQQRLRVCHMSRPLGYVTGIVDIIMFPLTQVQYASATLLEQPVLT